MMFNDPTVLTVGGLIGLAGAVAAVVKFWSWIQDRTQKQVDMALIPAMAKIGLAEIKADAVEREFMAFRLEVAREYVRHEHVKALDDRIDKGFSQLRADLNDLRAAVMDSLAAGARSPRRRLES